MQLNGRREITTPYETVDENNLIPILKSALSLHSVNAREIKYLIGYAKGRQPVLSRQKKYRKDICNRIVENHAAEIASFHSGYFLGEPLTYVSRGTREGITEEVAALNDIMTDVGKATHDKQLATWMAICGVGYRMVAPAKYDDELIELDTPSPESTFVVYYSGFGHYPLLGARTVTVVQPDGSKADRICGYTSTHYFEATYSGAELNLTRWDPHILGGVPIFEYRLNSLLMGSFEPAIPLLDAINTLQSNRVDGVEQFIQHFLKFVNCDIDELKLKQLLELGALSVRSVEGQHGDVDIVSQEMDQQQTQTLVDWLYDQALNICGMPTTRKGGTSSSDTGKAVFLRDGWSHVETRAQDSEALFRLSEKRFLRVVLNIAEQSRADFGLGQLSIRDVDAKFTRRQYDNLLTKTQSLMHMLESGIHPSIAITHCGLFNDPADVYEQSKEYLRKWEYEDAAAIALPEVEVAADG